MKTNIFFILAFILLPVIVVAQQKKPLPNSVHIKIKPSDKKVLKKEQQPLIITRVMDSANARTKKESLAIDNYARSYGLPPDHMPCLVPPHTNDSMNFFSMDVHEVRKKIDDMPVK